MKKNGFSLLEVLVALFIGTMIMSQLLEGMRQATRYLKRGIECSTVDRTVALMFNQLEKDLTAAFIPYVYVEKEEKKDSKKEKKEEEKKPPQQQPETKTKPKFKLPFLATVVDEDIRKPGAKKRELLSLLSFITTTPLELYDEQKTRMLRVGYILKESTDKKAGDPRSYTLIRKETFDCANEQFKETDESKKEKKKKITQYVIAHYIKTLSFEFTKPLEKDKDGKKQNDEEKIYQSFDWGEKEKSKDTLPAFVTIVCELWEPTFTRSYSYTISFPIFSSPAEPLIVQRPKTAQASTDPASNTNNSSSPQRNQQTPGGGKGSPVLPRPSSSLLGGLTQ